MSPDYDVVIVGGGMVGACLTEALKTSGLRIALIEAFDISLPQQPSYDERGIAISYGSQKIFDTMGLWTKLKVHSTAIADIHVSDRGHFGVTRLSAKQLQVPALGQVILARDLGKVLNDAMTQNPMLEVIYPKRVVAVAQHSDRVEITLDDDKIISAQLVVAADGSRSTLRDLLDLAVTRRDYQQTAITANVSTERPHRHRAFERFTEHGPIALLPMSENRSSLIWTVKSGEEKHLNALPDKRFLQALQQAFGYRLGIFTRVGERRHYPLEMITTQVPYQQRVLFIGNAAHSLHPIAGQGFNLGLRDVIALADALATKTIDCGATEIINTYQAWQDPDQKAIINATDSLVRLFSNRHPLLTSARSIGLTVLDCLPPAKRFFALKSMGLAKKQPRLGRGIAL